MAKGLKPDLWVKDIYSIDLNYLKLKGIKALFFDIDNTLVQYSDKTSDEKLNLWLEGLIDSNFKVGFLSNAKDYRIEKFAEGVYIKGKRIIDNPSFMITGSARKPLCYGYKILASKFKLMPSEVAMVGDQLYTDILGGNRFGCMTILVDPINKEDEHWFVSFKRIFEKRHLTKIKQSNLRK